VQEKLKGMWRVDAAADYEPPNAFYRAEEGGEMVPWRRNGRQRVFFNASVSGRREEGATARFERGKEHMR
jgi:hypothetical protein